MFIRSERLFLRPGWPEDWEQLYAGIADEGVVRNLARAPWPYTPEHAREFAGKPQDPRVPNFFVTLDGKVIGSAGLGRKDDGGVELGYWIARPYWGRGYATEAARAVLEIARLLGHGRVLAGHFVDNPASGRVLRKAGFRPLGGTRRRFSAARGHDVESVEYAADLAGCGDDDTATFQRAA